MLPVSSVTRYRTYSFSPARPCHMVRMHLSIHHLSWFVSSTFWTAHPRLVHIEITLNKYRWWWCWINWKINCFVVIMTSIFKKGKLNVAECAHILDWTYLFNREELVVDGCCWAQAPLISFAAHVAFQLSQSLTQDRSAVKLLMALRDQNQNQVSQAA